MKKIIDDLYDYDESDQSYIIKVSIEKYLDIFNTLDHYPIRKRDINQDVITYIEDCSNDIPLNRRIKLEIKINDEERDENLEQRIMKGVKNYFLYIMALHKNSSREVINTSILYIFIFIILTILTFGIEAMDIATNKIFLNTILEGLSIGTWVFLWEAIAGLVIKNKKNRFLINTYKRLTLSKLYFLYT